MRMKATGEILGYSDEITDLLVEGCVGEGLAFDFRTWLRNADLPRPEDVLKSNWSPDQRRLDVGYAVLTSVTQFVISTADRNEALEHAVGAWHLLNRFLQHNMGDMIVNSAQTFVKKKLSLEASPAVRDAATPVIRWMAQTKLLDYAQTN